ACPVESALPSTGEVHETDWYSRLRPVAPHTDDRQHMPDLARPLRPEASPPRTDAPGQYRPRTDRVQTTILNADDLVLALGGRRAGASPRAVTSRCARAVLGRSSGVR
ncbi:MAG: hypothetical protein LC808_29055, partial [Actinobacteria bacterium]|nr:hypothetical protein [Actinomycetota bacterium]